jgi:hypothetical protein
VAVTFGIEVLWCPPFENRERKGGPPSVVVTPFVYLFGLTTATLFTPLQAR